MSSRIRKSTGTRVAAIVAAPVLALTLLAPPAAAVTTTGTPSQTHSVRGTDGDDNDDCLGGGVLGNLLGGLLCGVLGGGK